MRVPFSIARIPCSIPNVTGVRSRAVGNISPLIVCLTSCQWDANRLFLWLLRKLEQGANHMNKTVQYPFVRITLAVLFVGIGVIVGQTILNLLRSALSITSADVANLLAFVLVTPATYFAYRMYVRTIEKRDPVELGFTNLLQEVGLGSLLGFGLFGFVIAFLWVLGFYRVNGYDFIWLSVLGALVGAFVSAFAQELIFRAVIYRIVEEWLGTWWALAISAVLFGLIHLTSSGATIISALAVALQAGVVLGAAYALTHRLWLTLGIHMAWDFANDGIFGVGVAGQTGAAIKGLLQATLNGPKLLTGGPLGVEASVITLVVMLIAGVVMLRRAHQKGRFVLPTIVSK
jgi:membrane protease YdiL (CAAX protease family)